MIPQSSYQNPKGYGPGRKKGAYTVLAWLGRRDVVSEQKYNKNGGQSAAIYSWSINILFLLAKKILKLPAHLLPTFFQVLHFVTHIPRYIMKGNRVAIIHIEQLLP